MKKFALIVLATAMLLSVTACGNQDATNSSDAGATDAGEVRTFRLGHPNASQMTDPDHFFATKWAEYVEEYSGGTLKIDIYGDASLGADRDLFVQVKDGMLDLAPTGTVNDGGVYTPLQIFDLPYVFMNDEEYRTLLYDDRGAYDFLREGLRDEMNMHYFGLTEAGAKKLWGTGDVPTNPEELVGLKIRVGDSAVLREIWDMFKCNAANIAWSEAFSAHQQKVIDGAEYAVLIGNSAGFYEVCDYVQSTDINRMVKLVVMSQPVWESLTAEQQECFTKAYWAALDDQIEMIDKANEEAISKWAESGCIYYETFDKEAAYELLVPTVWDDFREEVGSENLDKLVSVLEEIRSEQNAE